jgi:formylglycine-generating enzyme required for sulfatase activity
MPGKVFINYRRDDARDMAARIRDRLAQTFGDTNVFMDVDHLIAGQRFDKELAKALGQTDVFIAVIGSRWLELLAERQRSGVRDYVREEIAWALRRGTVVIPALIERTPLPQADALPADIRNLVLYQKHAVGHEQFGRDIAGLVEAIRFTRRATNAGAGKGAVGWVGTVGVASLLSFVVGVALLSFQWGSIPWSTSRGGTQQVNEAVEAKEVQPRWPALQEARQLHPKEIAPQAVRIEAVSAKVAEADPSRPGRVFRDCPDCPEMVVVPAGEFMMGSPPDEEGRYAQHESPQHKVTIHRSFAVGKYEVTFAEWDACVAAGKFACRHRPDDEGWGRGNRPVMNLTQRDITQDFLPWLSKKTGKPYRLLTEAEWEYAARAGSTTRYYFGTDESDLCTYENVHDLAYRAAKVQERAIMLRNEPLANCQDGYVNTAPVGSFKPNAFGLHDMLGNVQELAEDCWDGSYQGAPTDGRARTTSTDGCFYRAIRGGAWFSWPNLVRSATRTMHRDTGFGDYRGPKETFGFRLARSLN